MTRLFPKDPLFLALLGVFLLLPFAQVKLTCFGMPLYLPEIALLIALFLRIIADPAKVSPQYVLFRDSWMTIGTTLFALGALLSLLTHPFTLTGLGMLKSWFLFPILAAWLLFPEAEDPKKQETFLSLWFISLVMTALGSLSYVVFGELTFDGRLAGSYPSPNFLALFIAPAIPLFFHLDYLLKDSQGATLKRFLLVVGSLVVVACLFFTHSYGTWAAIFVATSLFFFGKTILFGLKKGGILLFLILLTGVGIFSFLESGSAKWQALISFDVRSSLSSRVMIWRAAERMFFDQPLFGIGLGRFQEVYLEYQRYFPPYLEWAVPEPHNWYLAVLLNTGSIGFFGFAIMIGRFGFLAGRDFFASENKKRRQGALFLMSMLSLFLVYGLTDTPYFKNDLALTFFLWLVMGFALIKAQSDRVAG